MSLALDFSTRTHPVANHSAARRGATGRQSAAQRPLRLTRRGRLVFIGLPVLLVVGLLLAAIGMFTSPAQASSHAPAGADTSVVTVLPGDSLWSVAERVAPDRAAGDVVADIVTLNALDSNVLTSGQQLQVPKK